MGEYPSGTFRFKKLCGSFWKGETLRFADYTALIELGYALVSSGDINHGNIEIKEFMNYLSTMFNIDLGGYYDAYIAMKERKDRTSYLNKLIENLSKRMDEDDRR